MQGLHGFPGGAGFPAQTLVIRGGGPETTPAVTQAVAASISQTLSVQIDLQTLDQPVFMEESWIDSLPRHEPERSRHIADYIAGMTDRYAITCHAQIYGTTPEGLRNV